MKNIAITFMILIFIGILGFYLIIDKKTDIPEINNEIRVQKSETEEYCLFKGGEIEIFKNKQYCVLDEFDSPVLLDALLEYSLANTKSKGSEIKKP